MSKQLRLDVAQLTDVGRKRPHNEDNMAYVIPKDPMVMARKGALFIVADGMGGHAAGEVASEIAVDTISNLYYQDDSEDIAVSLLHAIKRANTLIHQRAAENMLRTGMGTTCVAAVMRGSTAYIANVGDSRAYIIRGGHVRQVSQDHSWVAEQVRAGLLTEDQARSHAQRNVITRCLGTQADVEIDVFSEQLEENDSIVLCTDGLSGLVSDEELGMIVERYVPQESVYHLVERANENGGSDNITAIVIRVLEIGVEPPGARHPVYVGSRESIESATTLGMLPNMSLGMSSHSTLDGRVPSAPLRITTGPLGATEPITAPQSVLRMPQRRRSRLFYPTLALLVLLVVALVGGSAYYVFRFLLNPPVNVDRSLTMASSFLSRAKGEIGTDPATALSHLATAQSHLHEVQGATLDATQQKQLQAAQGQLTQEVKDAITAYNERYLITSLSCANPLVNTINMGSTHTMVSSIARALDAKGNPYSYALGESDHQLYQVNTQFALEHPFPFPGTPMPQVTQLTSDGPRLLALTMVNSAPPQYALNILVPQAPSGALKSLSTSQIDATLTSDGEVPSFLTAWGTDVYVVVTSQTSPTTAHILDYQVDPNKGVQSNKPRVSTISITSPLVAAAAFPKGQLFLLQSNGSLQSLQFASGNQTAVNVVMDRAIAQPLTVTAQEFTAGTPVPTANTPSSTVLSLPGQMSTMLLAAGQADSTQHLYIMDGTNHRILDLRVASTPAPTAKGTPARSDQNASPPVTMSLQRQYISPLFQSRIRGMVADPKSAQLDLLMQNNDTGGQQTLTSINVDPNHPTTCNA